MSDTERVIGKLEEFKRATEKRMDATDKSNKERFDKIDKKLEKLTLFEVKVTAYAVAAMFAIKVVASLIMDAIAKV